MGDATAFKTGCYVDVSFPDKGVNNLSMSVQSVSSRAGDKVSVVLKCTSMNKEISALRKEKAQITVKTYTGLRISNEALTSDENGTEGVYILSGKRVSFKPVNIIHYGENYVIATAVTFYNEDGSVDYEKTSENEIKAFDRVITKGRNLSDGKVIGGNSTDRALMNFIINAKAENKINKDEVTNFSSFDSTKKMSSVTISRNGNSYTYVKGAPEKLLLRCTPNRHVL